MISCRWLNWPVGGKMPDPATVIAVIGWGQPDTWWLPSVGAAVLSVFVAVLRRRRQVRKSKLVHKRRRSWRENQTAWKLELGSVSGATSLTAETSTDPAEAEGNRLTDDFPRFLTDELLPLAEEALGVQSNPEPARRAVCGFSSGGIAAFNAAWHRPEVFGNVVSSGGAFINIEGGHNYPYLVRATGRKPIQVWLQTGQDDGDIPWGSIPLANQQMAAALEFAGYRVRFEFGSGGHSLRHAGALFAETLRWLWGGRED